MTELKTVDVEDKNTDAIWKSDRNHKATTFNNHEVVRPTADIMAKVQLKHGVTETTINAKKYVASLISADIGEVVPFTDLTAPIHETTATADTTKKEINGGIAQHYVEIIEMFKKQIATKNISDNKVIQEAVNKNVPENLRKAVYNAVKLPEQQLKTNVDLFA
jgi:hypothetical protein